MQKKIRLTGNMQRRYLSHWDLSFVHVIICNDCVFHEFVILSSSMIAIKPALESDSNFQQP